MTATNRDNAAVGRSCKAWIIPKRPWRLLALFLIFLLIFAWDHWRRQWSPQVRITTEHYVLQSTATPQQTREVADVVEALYDAYARVFSDLSTFNSEHAKLKVKLFRDRKEFRHVNRVRDWAEAFYRKPYCYAYYSATEANPYHWMVHEAAHQLNREVAQLDLAKWVDEGIADYFGSSVVSNGVLKAGHVDVNTYPIWWLAQMPLSGDIHQDIRNTHIIPLRAIVTGKGGPNIDKFVNLYYIEWWSLTHFLFEYRDGKYRPGYLRLIQQGAALESFEKHIGPIEQIQDQWYRYLQERRSALGGYDKPLP